MKERPILFSAPMIRALLAGTKTQTRRVLAFPPSVVARGPHIDRVFYTRGSGQYPGGNPEYTGDQPPGVLVSCSDHTCQRVPCPFGVPGDRLWVREAWQTIHVFVDPETGCGDGLEYSTTVPTSDRDGWWTPVYAATDPQADEHRDDRGFPWRPSIHMPRWASRITLEVTGVRVERLQEIGLAAAEAEGAHRLPLQEEALGGCWWTMDAAAGPDHHARTAAGAFRKGWDTINGKRAPWDSNPFVWVVSFRRVQP